MAAVFWIALGALIYHHLVYPVVLGLLVRRKAVHEKTASESMPDEPSPSVTIIVPCHNEASVIERKIANLQSFDYPRDRFSVVLALDGCTDGTGPLAVEALTCGDLRWNIENYKTNVGKIAVLNDQIRRSNDEIVALSDASAIVSPNALRRAAAHFRNADVAVVCAAYTVDDANNPGESAYWSYQTRIKLNEALVGGAMGAHGAFYLFRRHLWSELPTDTINDDFVLPMRIVLKGYRLVYDQKITCHELETTQRRQEFRRRVRIGAGNLQQAIRLRALALPNHGTLALTFWSGKGLRAAAPFLIACVMLSSVVLACQHDGFYRWVVATETIIILIGVAGLVLPHAMTSRPMRAVSYVLLGYFAAGVGAILLLAGRGAKLWRYSSLARHVDADHAQSK